MHVTDDSYGRSSGLKRDLAAFPFPDETTVAVDEIAIWLLTAAGTAPVLNRIPF